MIEKVKVWEEDVLLPTYAIGKAEKNPMFLEKRVYQGSKGVVYPYPVVEKIDDVCKEQSYHAVYLENEYVKVMILPELGGRVQMAYDKIKQRHFIYYNHVIKPALVGLTDRGFQEALSLIGHNIIVPVLFCRWTILSNEKKMVVRLCGSVRENVCSIKKAWPALRCVRDVPDLKFKGRCITRLHSLRHFCGGPIRQLQ